eukprot:CAMPEP_0172868630 /NCGR_PEP_ID=MMETSP1075-20121228/86797_1 /TAXON_ID=2916 /ORGANISM="Ceratium fusus, Strain PA161109" /LENGTH=32 /DNA_ID= /DNA_START= /DNA_END= /DNA_ORIENTATION=
MGRQLVQQENCSADDCSSGINGNAEHGCSVGG